MDCQRACITDVCHMVEKLESVDEARPRSTALPQLEADETPEAAPEIGRGAPALLGVLMQAWVDYARDLRMALQIERNLACVVAVLAHPQGQRLKPLDKMEGVKGAHARTG